MRMIISGFLVCLFIKSSLLATNILVPGALTHENKAAVNQIIQGSIPIQNEGDKPVTVRVSLTDYLFNSQGQSDFPVKGTCPRSNSSWIKTNKTFFEIAPHTTYSFSYTLQVPNDDSLQGSYWSIFLIEPVEETFATPEKEQSLGVQTIIRYGVQVITHVGEKGSYDLKILDKKVTKEESKKSFKLSAENLGTLSLSPTLALELVNYAGKKMGRFEAAKQRILPTCSVSYQVDLSTVPDGKYKAMVILDHGDNAFFGAQYDLIIE